MKIFLLKEWTDFYTDGSEGTDLNSTINKTQRNDLSSYENAYVKDCIFQNILETNDQMNGGAIYYSKSSKLLVEFCSFNECNTKAASGGAIFFDSSGHCVLFSVCGVKCNSGYYEGQFCCVYVSGDSQYKNYIIDSSVTLTENTKAYSTLCHRYGNVLCKGVNVSNNKVNQVSGIIISQSATSSISFSSFRNNNATNNRCFACLSSGNIQSTNIIENSQNGSFSGIIQNGNSVQLIMNHCAVFANSAPKAYIFYGTFQCIECTIPKDQRKSYNSIDYGITKESFINQYSYLSLDECQATFEIWELSPIKTNPLREAFFEHLPRRRYNIEM